MKPEFVLLVVFLQRFQKLSTVKFAHGILWEKVSFMCCLYKLTGCGQPATRKHGMDMRVEIQTLTLCVQYGNNPGSCAEMLFVTAEGKQGVRGTPEHQPVQQLLIFINQAVKLIRNCENGMIVSNSLYEFGIAFHDPFLLNRSLTAGTVPVITGGCVDFYMSALFTVTDIISKTAGFAVGDTVGRFPLLRSKAMAVQVLRQELLKSITDGVRRIICQGHRDFSHSFHC